MFVKTSAVLAVLAVAARVVVATPPACVLGAVNTQDDPSDFKAVCGADEVQSYLSKNCGDFLDTAQTYFGDYCKAAGVKVASYDNGSTSSKPSSSATKASHNSSPSATPSGSNSYSGGDSTTGTNADSASSSSPSGTSTGSAGFATATANISPTASDNPTVSGTVPSQTGSDVAGSTTTTPTGGAARLGMDILGMTALSMFGLMLAM